MVSKTKSYYNRSPSKSGTDFTDAKQIGFVKENFKQN